MRTRQGGLLLLRTELILAFTVRNGEVVQADPRYVASSHNVMNNKLLERPGKEVLVRLSPYNKLADLKSHTWNRLTGA